MLEDDNENKINNQINMQNNKNISNYKQNIPFQQNYNNRYYNNINNINNINNNLINQNSINIINNNIDYIGPKGKIPSNAYINNNMNMQLNPKITKIKCTCSKTGCRKKYCACFSKKIFCDGCECKDCENKPLLNEKVNKNNSNNNIIKEENNEKINYSKTEISNPKSQRVICNCTKSNCMKKYCECYKQGFNCNGLCRCLECKNKNYNNNTYNGISNDSNNFYSYALNSTNININNNMTQVHDYSTSYFPETFGRSIDYSNPINFQSEAFGIYIKKEKLKIEGRIINLNLNNNSHIIPNNSNNENNNDNNNDKEIISKNNVKDLNETPKFSNKKRLRNNNSAGVNTCPTTNSSNRRRRSVPVVNKNIKKKKLQLN